MILCRLLRSCALPLPRSALRLPRPAFGSCCTRYPRLVGLLPVDLSHVSHSKSNESLRAVCRATTIARFSFSCSFSHSSPIFILFLTTFSRFLFALKWKEVFSGKKLNESLQNVVLVVPLVAGSLRRRCCFDEVPSLGYCLPGRSITCLSSVE